MLEKKVIQKNNNRVIITVNFKEEGTPLQEVIEDLFINYYKSAICGANVCYPGKTYI
ncbi:MAG: hypothetical protein FWF46_06760 [Oscillospiraceae bacterium]|nr:hypothetical protein [Oscillospiraceae bacterium]